MAGVPRSARDSTLEKLLKQSRGDRCHLDIMVNHDCPLRCRKNENPTASKFGSEEQLCVGTEFDRVRLIRAPLEIVSPVLLIIPGRWHVMADPHSRGRRNTGSAGELLPGFERLGNAEFGITRAIVA